MQQMNGDGLASVMLTMSTYVLDKQAQTNTNQRLMRIHLTETYNPYLWSAT